MSGKITNNYGENPLKEKVLNDLTTREETAHERVLEKQQQYNVAMKKLNIFQEKKYYAEKKARPINGKENSWDKAQYNEIASQAFGCEVDADVLRGSLQSNLSYYSKTSQSVFMANAMLGS